MRSGHKQICTLYFFSARMLVLFYVFYTCLSNSGIVAAAVVQVSHATVFGKRVHNSGRADCVDE